MGMRKQPDSGSLAPVQRALTSNLQTLVELNRPDMPQCFLVEFDVIVDSADMNQSDWNMIANVVAANYYEYDGFVIIHGTDTMAYTASALSFMLENVAKPVILTGSQLPFEFSISDARQNFLGAVVFAGLMDICEVCVFFNGKLFRGNRTRKVNSEALDAFHSPNYPPLGEVGVDVSLQRRWLRDPPRACFRLQTIACTEIVVVWVIPGFSEGCFEPLCKNASIKGMVLLLYGCGNAPMREAKFTKALSEMAARGVVIVACSQCSAGKVHLNKYAVGKVFEDCGVIGVMDMTPESAVAKLSYLISKDLTSEQVRNVMHKSIRGEMTSEESPNYSQQNSVSNFL